MYKLIKTSKGFTLVEVIVSMAILVLIATVFVPLFGYSFTNIFSYGERDTAMSVASDIMEELYAEQPLQAGSIADIDSIEKDNSDYFIYNDESEFNVLEFEEDFDVVENNGITGYKVTIEVPYKDGDRHVTLTSFVRGE